MSQLKLYAILALLISMPGTAWGDLIVQASNPGVQSTATPGAVTYDFNNLPLGLNANLAVSFGAVTGVYDRLSILPADTYGGANGTRYPEALIGQVPSYNLTLSAPVNYFGMWWSAGDSSNQLDFYRGNTLVASYNTATALGVLPATYHGNPVNGGDTAEPFAYLNFYGTAGVTFDRIRLSSINTNGGFESDNHAIAVNALPGAGLDVGNQPTISATKGVVNGASFQENFASGTWLTIRGSKLSSTTRIWQASDFNGTSLPTSLDGVQVTINGKSAYVYYISPTQLNVLTPDDSTTGPVPVQVVTKDGASAAVSAVKSALAPGFFAYSQQSGRYLVAQDSSTYALIGPTGLLGSAGPTRPAVSGETLTFYATGLGSTNPSYLTGQLIPAPAPLSNAVQVLIGGVPATTTFAGITGSGLYQINVVVPTVDSGDAAVVLKIGNAQSQANAYIPISNPPARKFL